MKTTITTILAATVGAVIFWSCGQNSRAADSRQHKMHPAWADSAVIYEMNVRQLTPEGTLKAAIGELGRLKELGVDVIWVMPIQPIGIENRKGGLGSYYAISDYEAVNPEFGTMADARQLVDSAHNLGMKVILDWVANHTAPDHIWAKNDGWHKRDSLGKMAVMYDWTDITELDYENADMRRAMQRAMLFWVDSVDVDGFRCDMAMLVPLDFWQETLRELQMHKPDIFMLAEAEEPDLTQEAFDMYYAWDLHHTMNAAARGEVGADSLWLYFEKQNRNFPTGAIPMTFTSNHDENSHQGSEFERMGVKGAAQMALFSYLVPSMPLIYAGQEFGSDRKLRFFDKDTISRVDSAVYTSYYKSLNRLRKDNPVLWSSHAGAPMVRIETSHPKEVFAMRRIMDGKGVAAFMNVSKDTVEVTSKDAALRGKWIMWPSNEKVELSKDQKFDLTPGQSIVLIKR